MHQIKWLFSSINYGFGVFYSFTFIDVIRKVIFDEFHLTNATNFVQFLLTLVGLFFAYYKLRSYMRDSKTKSAILEEELIAKQYENYQNKRDKEIINPDKLK